MEVPNIPAVPFVNRAQLSFAQSSAFTLVVDIIAHDSDEFELRGFTKNGFFTFRFVPIGNSSIETFIFAVSDVPIMVSATVANSSTSNAFAHMSIYFGIDNNRTSMLCQGAVSGVYGIAWPHQPQLTEQQKNGVICSVAGANPAAGNEVSDIVPDNQIWEILSARVTLVTDATVANRTVAMLFSNGAGTIFKRSAGTTQPADDSQSYNFIAGGATQVIVSSESQEVAIPSPLILHAGDTIQTLSTNLQAGDNYSAVEYFIRRNYTARNA